MCPAGESIPDTNFRLSDEVRRQLSYGIDLHAFERLLSLLPKASREHILEVFLSPTNSSGRMGGRSIRRFEQPELNRLLGEVWAPVRARRQAAPEWRMLIQEHAIRSAPVTIAVVDSLPDTGAVGVILRRVNEVPRDVILIRRHAMSAECCAAAVERLLEERRQHGIEPPYSYEVPVSSRTPSTESTDVILPSLQESVSKLSALPVRSLPGVGEVQAFEYAVIDLGGQIEYEPWDPRWTDPS